METIRICKICGKEFIPNSNSQKYCSSECSKIARKETNKKYYQAHREEIKIYSKQHYQTCSEQYRAYSKKYRRAHLAQYRAYSREYNQTHLEQHNASNRNIIRLTAD